MTTPAIETAPKGTLSALLSSLEELHGDGEAQWLALCPGHDDSSPSLRIALGEPRDDDEYGPVLLHCRANCSKDDVLAGLEMTRRDLASLVVDDDCWDVPVEAGRVRKGRKATGTAPYAPITPDAQRELSDDIEFRSARLWDDRSGGLPGQIRPADARAYAASRWGLTNDQIRTLQLGFEDGRGQYGRSDRGVFVPFQGVRHEEDGTWQFGGPMGFQVRHLNEDAKIRWATPAAPANGSFGWTRIGIFDLTPDIAAEAQKAVDELGWTDETTALWQRSLLPVVVTEGPGDALTAAALGFPAIAVRGASLARNTEVQEEITAAVRLVAARRNIDPVALVCGDGDAAGQQFSQALRAALLRGRVLVSEMAVPDGEDLTSMREKGAVATAHDVLALQVAPPALPVEWTDLSIPTEDLLDVLPTDVLAALGVKASTSAPVASASPHASAVNALGSAFGQLDLDPWAHEHTDLGAARLLQTALVQLGTPARHCPQKGGWLIYDPSRGIWTVDAARRLQAVAHRVADVLSAKATAAQKVADGMPEGPEQVKAMKTAEAIRRLGHRFESTRMTNAMLAQLESILVASPTEFDGEDTRDLMVVGNGVVDLRTSQLRPFDAGLMITVGTEIVFEPSATAPMWDDFVQRVSVADPVEMPRYLQKLSGLMASGRVEQLAHFFLGSGANGKGVFLNVIQTVIGAGIVSTNASTFEDASHGEGPTPMLAALEPARGVVIDELKAKQVLDDGRLKTFSGDMVVTTRRLHQDPHSWRPRFTLVVATNVAPRFATDAPGHSLKRRVRIVPFEMQISDSKQDPQVVDKMLAQKEGILAWIVRGAQLRYEEGLPEPRFIAEASAEMWASTNPLVDLMEGDGSPFVLSTDLEMDRTTAFEVYADWAHKAGTPVWSRQRFYDALDTFGVRGKKTNGKRVLVGIGLSENPPPLPAF